MKMNFRARKAFTLIEIMAASAIMSGIVVLVLILTSNVLNTWTSASSRLQSFFDGGVVGSIIQEDLESMFVRKDGNIWFTVNYPPTPVGMLSGRSNFEMTPMRPPELMFFSRTSYRPLFTFQNNTKITLPGNLCAIKYQIAVKNPFLDSTGNYSEDEMQNNAFYGIYRAVIDSRSTMTEVIPTVAEASANNIFALSDMWERGKSSILAEDGSFKQGVELNKWALSPENLLTMNLIDFRLTFAVTYPNPEAGEFQQGANVPKYKVAYIPPGVPFTVGDTISVSQDGIAEIYEYTDRGKSHGTVDPDALGRGYISSIDVSMVFISEQGAREMRALMKSGNMTEEKFKDLATRYGSKAISKTIELVSEPQE